MDDSDNDSGLSTSWNTEESSFHVSELDSGLSLLNVSEMDGVDNGDDGRILLIISIVLYTTHYVYFIEIIFDITFIDLVY